MRYQVYWNGKRERYKTLSEAMERAKFYTLKEEGDSAFAVVIERGNKGKYSIFHVEWIGTLFGHIVTKIM